MSIYNSFNAIQFLREQQPAYATTLVQTRLLPLYKLSVSLPYLVATANWVLGELASCLPEVRLFLTIPAPTLVI